MFFSEYALEDILKSGIYNEDDKNVIDHAEEMFQRKTARRQRPKNPFQNSAEDVDKTNNEHDVIEDEILNEDNESNNDEEFQELYDNLQKYNSEYLEGNIEEIYENLVGLAHEEATNTSGSFLPPEVKK